MKKNILIPLAATVLAAALLLGCVFVLRPLGESRAQAEHLRLLHTLLPDSGDFTVESYAGEDANIRSVHKADNGFVIETVVAGYAGDIRMFIGVSREGTVTGVLVDDMSETFTLGAEALTDHVFLAQLLHTAGEAEVGVNVDALTGATVTSRAVVRSVNSAVAYVTGADVDSGATSWGG